LADSPNNNDASRGPGLFSLAGLTRGEIFGRLFGLYFGPQFVVFALVYFLQVLPADPWSGWSVLVGSALVIAAAALDASRSGVSPLWAIATIVPFLGWVAYAWRRATDRPVLPTSPQPTWSRVFDLFTTHRYRLETKLSPEECAARLRPKTGSLWSVRSWFAPASRVPFQGSVSVGRFRLKIRHVMTRPTLLDEASGRISRQEDRTVIDLGVGVNTFDRAFVVLYAGFPALVMFALIAGGQPADVLFIPAFFIAMLLLVTILVRTIGRSDEARLYEIIRESLEARSTGEGGGSGG